MGTAGPPPVPGSKGVGAQAPDIGAGYHLGKYEVIKRIAVGGMAEIFLAKVEGLPGFQKVVAIKRILPQLSAKRDFVEMFLDEARIAATLHHPNLVQVYDVGVADGNYFMAMEYLHGQDVRSIMKTLLTRGMKLPLEHALNVMINVASGLHYAHEKVGFDGQPLNIIHRDVTPQNVIITFEGGVKLLDFGIAKASNRVGESTRFGTLKGKVPYMSPEQCRGEALDQRTDVFSLGIMLYELTLGRRLFKAQSEFEVMKRVVDGRVTPPSKIDPNYDMGLEKIVMRALDKDRAKRYQTAADLQADLEGLVRLAGLYVSPSALKQFMEKLFGQKIEAWRVAQARGQTLGDHLQNQRFTGEHELVDGDLEEVDEEAAAEIERGGPAVVEMDADPDTSSELVESPVVRITPLPRYRNQIVVAAVALVGIAAAGIVWKTRSPRVHMPVAAPVAVAREPAVAPPPPPVAPVPTPAPELGILKITTAPAGATLYLDGKKLDSPSPATLDGIEAAREHTLLVQADGYKDAFQRFTLKPREMAAVDVKLLRETSPSHHKGRPGAPAPTSPPSAAASPVQEVKLEGEGTLVLASSPWCNVSIDGADKGPTPVNLKLPAGKHSVSLTNPEFKISRTMTIVVQPGETLRKKLDFSE